MTHDLSLIAMVSGGIALLLLLVIRFRLHAFPALILVSLLIGLAALMPPAAVIRSIEVGMGETLDFVAVVVGLGAMFGRLLEASGGAESLARGLIRAFGESKAQWALAATGFIVSIPVFFDVGFIILVPLVYGLTRKTGRPVLYYGVPLLAGLAVTHAFVPPTPGPIAVADLLGAELGWVILLGIVAGIPCTLVAGPLFARWIARRVPAGIPSYAETAPPQAGRELPPLGTVAALILLPLGLILANTVSKQVLAETSRARDVLMFAGHPFVALLTATLLCFWLLGTRRGFTRSEVQEIAAKALEPAGIIILVTGAGGVLKQVLIDSGVGDVVKNALSGSPLPLLVLAFLVAAAVRVMQGSATVAMMAGAGLIAPVLEGMPVSQPSRALLVVSIAAGATIASHVNDSGFWLVNRYFGLSVSDTLRSWTVMTTLIALVGLAAAGLLSLVVG